MAMELPEGYYLENFRKGVGVCARAVCGPVECGGAGVF